MARSEIDCIIDKFNKFTEKPVKFLAVQEDLKDDFKNLVKSMYDYTKQEEKFEKREVKCALPKLIVEDCDEEQIWQEIELQNNECWDQLVWEVANCMSIKKDLVFPVQTDAEADDQTVDEVEENIGSPLDDDLTLEENQIPDTNRPKTKLKSKSNFMPSIVDDQFFKLQEMEQFLLKEEKSDGKKVKEDSDEESIDMFEEEDDDEAEDEQGGGRNVMYSDFFDTEDGNQEEEDVEENEQLDSEFDSENDYKTEDKKSVTKSKKKEKKVRFAEASSSDDNNDSDVNNIVAEDETAATTNEKKSEFEMRQERLKKQIEKLEEKTLNEAPWQLKGEIDAGKRPQNSLLEEVVDFDLTARPAPIITEQTTLTLEDIIRQRIKDKAWDDVEKKEKAVDDQLNFRKTEILDHSKSKLSLAQVYEAEYLKQKQAASGEVEDEKEPEAHKEIREEMSQLFAKLDALCHYHYTPKPAQAEVKIISNTPAISMEEVAPVATSDAALLAPEEVKRKHKGDLMSKEERTQTDKKRERRKKKKLQRAKGGKVTKVTDHRNTIKGTESNDKSLKTSKAFFQQLNDNTTSIIKSKKHKNVYLGKNKGK